MNGRGKGNNLARVGRGSLDQVAHMQVVPISVNSSGFFRAVRIAGPDDISMEKRVNEKCLELRLLKAIAANMVG